MKHNMKSVFSSFASLALAAVVVFASSTCSAAILIKPRSSDSGGIVDGVVIRWNKYKGAKSYTVLRSHNKKNIKYAKVVKRSIKKREFWDWKVKVTYKYYYWVVPNVKNSTKNLFSSSQSKKCVSGGSSFWGRYTYDRPGRSNKVRKGKKFKVGLLVSTNDGKRPYKTLAKHGAKWRITYSGVHKWHKKSGSKGQLGYFTSSKKGTGYYSLKVGDYTVIKKRKIVWK